MFCGLREVPLVPIRESQELLPTSRCRKAESSLLGLLGLGPKDLALVNLGIPTEVPLAEWILPIYHPLKHFFLKLEVLEVSKTLLMTCEYC